MKLIKCIFIIPMQHNNQVQIVIMRVRADIDSRIKCDIHKNDQELAKGTDIRCLAVRKAYKGINFLRAFAEDRGGIQYRQLHLP